MPAMGIAPKPRLDVAFAGERLPDALYSASRQKPVSTTFSRWS